MLAALVAGGCGNVAEKAIEKASGCKDVNLDDKGVAAKCGDSSFEVGGNVKLPEGFPAALKPPKGAKLYSAARDKSSGTTSFNLTMTVPGTAKDVAKQLKSLLSNAEFTISQDSLSEGTSGLGGSLSARDSTWEVLYTFGSDPDASAGKDAIKGTFVIQVVRELTADERTTSTSEPSNSANSPDDSTESGSGSGVDSSGTGSATLPDGFPSELRPSSESRVTSAMTTTSEGKRMFVVETTSSGSVSAVYDSVKSQLESADYTLDLQSLTTTADGDFGIVGGSNDQWTVQVTIAVSSGKTTAGYAVSEK